MFRTVGRRGGAAILLRGRLIGESELPNPRTINVLMSPGPRELKDNPCLKLLFAEVGDDNINITTISGKSDILKRADVIHINWPEWLIRWDTIRSASYDIMALLGLLWIARRRGAAIVWTGHNLEPHDLRRPKLWKIFQRLFVAQLDLLISFSNGATELLRCRYPRLVRVPTAVVPHGHYRDYYTAHPYEQSFRQRNGLDDRPVLLCFGLIKSYKNIPELIRAWKHLSEPRPQLVIAGQPITLELERAIVCEAKDAEGVHLFLRFISESEVPTFFAVADVLLMTYAGKSALNSGAAHLALSLGKPAVLNDTAVNRDLKRVFGSDWIYLCDGTTEDALEVAINAAGIARAGIPEIDIIGYGELAARMRQAYLAALTLRSRRSALRLTLSLGARSLGDTEIRDESDYMK